MKGYLLSVEELNNGTKAQRLLDEALQKLDVHRLAKVNRLRVGKAKNQAVGAGLLLQLAVQEQISECSTPEEQISREQDMRNETTVLERITLANLLERLGDPVQIAYSHGTKGKPDFADAMMGHFNLSHSEEYVCAVFDRRELGVDIQWMRPLKNMRMAERFFSQGEKQALADCSNPGMREKLFYRIWVKKESYAKLTGEGIAAVVEQDTFALARQVVWQEWEMPEGYCMAVCQYRE